MIYDRAIEVVTIVNLPILVPIRSDALLESPEHLIYHVREMRIKSSSNRGVIRGPCHHGITWLLSRPLTAVL